MKHKTSIFWTIPKEEFQTLLNECNSFSDILRKKNMCVTGHQYRVIHERIKNDNLNISHFQKGKCLGARDGAKLIEVSFDVCFKQNSQCHTSTAKEKIIKYTLIPYECQNCKNAGTWNGLKLSLQLDHKNGVRNDHRLENLRFLCPNCHSQTGTFGRKIRNTK